MDPFREEEGSVPIGRWPLDVSCLVERVTAFEACLFEASSVRLPVPVGFLLLMVILDGCPLVVVEEFLQKLKSNVSVC